MAWAAGRALFFESLIDYSRPLPTGFEALLNSNPRTYAHRPETTETEGKMIALDSRNALVRRGSWAGSLGVGIYFQDLSGLVSDWPGGRSKDPVAQSNLRGPGGGWELIPFARTWAAAELWSVAFLQREE